MENAENSPVTINLLNINGQLLDFEQLDYSNGTYQMNLSKYPEGIYLIQVQTDETQIVQKIVKQ